MISEQLLQRLRDTLLTCAPAGSDGDLQALFVDARLAPWRDLLPAASSRAARIDALIATLDRHRNTSGEPALLLLLHVLADRADPGDQCREDLRELARQLAAGETRDAAITAGSPLPARRFAACLESLLAPLRVLHERHGADPPPLPDLLRQVGKLFRRNTFCESPRTCLKQLWTERLCATLEMLDVLAAYERYPEQHAAYYRNEGAGVDDALAVLAGLQPAVRAYAHALTNFFSTEVEVDAARERLRAGQGDNWKEVLDAARLDREAILAATMKLCSPALKMCVC
jgi:hypothetical protein